MKRIKQPAIYIMASRKNGTIYVGITSNLVRRIYEHRNELIDGFTKKYKCNLLVYYELHSTMEQAITREKHLKRISRIRKLYLINSSNGGWRDLYEDIAKYE